MATKKPSTAKVVSTGFNAAQQLMDKSNKTMTTNITSLLSVLKDMECFESTLVGLNEEIFKAQGELDNLKDLLAIERRKHSAELDLLILEDKQSVLHNLMFEFGFATISKTTLESLQEELAQAKSERKGEIDKAVAIVSNQLKLVHDHDAIEVKSKHEVEVAKTNADVDSLRQQVVLLTQNNQDLKDMLKEEREARVKVAEASQTVYQTTPLTNVR